jgi:hypothetical protein
VEDNRIKENMRMKMLGKVILALCFTKYRAMIRIHYSFKHYAMKTYWGSGCVALHILNLGTRWR